jgi:hypothetical protein
LLAEPRTMTGDPARVVDEILTPGPLGRAVLAPVEQYLAAQGFDRDVRPVLYPIYLAAFLAEYGADTERRGIVTAMRGLLQAALDRPA